MTDWKERLGMVYSTDPAYKYTAEQESESKAPIAAKKQHLRVALDKRNRKGKQVTIVSDFIGTADQLETLGKTLKTKCGVGGSSKEEVIIIQGDHRDRIVSILNELGYSARKI